MALWPIFNLFLSNGCLEISVIFQYTVPFNKLSVDVWYLWVESMPSAKSAGHRILATVFYYGGTAVRFFVHVHELYFCCK